VASSDFDPEKLKEILKELTLDGITLVGKKLGYAKGYQDNGSTEKNFIDDLAENIGPLDVNDEVMKALSDGFEIDYIEGWGEAEEGKPAKFTMSDLGKE